MRKKALSALVGTLEDKIRESQNHIDKIEFSLSQKEQEIRELKESLGLKEKEIVSLREEMEKLSLKSAECSQQEKEEEEKTSFKYEDFNFFENSEDSANIKEYSVKAIGKIVSETVKINCVISSSSCENKKELLNLVLGRSEVAKEEIAIVMVSNLDDEIKKQSIDREVAAVNEYFSSVLSKL